MPRKLSLKIESLIIDAGVGYSTNTFSGRESISLRPYKDKNILMRIFREIWFILKLPEVVWYNKAILKYDAKRIYIKDPLITVNFLKWLVKTFSDSVLSFDYDNQVGKAKHLLPNQIPNGIVVTTFNPEDSKKYNLVLRESKGEFPKTFLREKKEIEYDVFFVGSDKGRAVYILRLNDFLVSLGLKTKIIIVRNGRFSKNKKYYSKAIPYSEVLDYVSKSRAILNIVSEGQTGATVRDYEALFLKAKLITNNKNIKSYDFYNKNNVFIIGEDNLDSIKDFVLSPLDEIDNRILEKHLG